MPTPGTSWAWWALFTATVATGFIMTLTLDGFFGASKSEETLTLGVRSCAPGILGGLGFTNAGTPANVGLPRLDYLQNSAVMGDILTEHPDASRRARRSANNVRLNKGEDVANGGHRLFSANETGFGPVPAATSDCKTLLENYVDAENKTAYFEDIDNNPFGTVMCMAMSFPAGSTCMTHPHLQVREDPDTADAFVAAPGHEQPGTLAPAAVMALKRFTGDAGGTLANSDVSLTAWRASAGFKHCEVLSRKECQERHDTSKFSANNQAGSLFSECVASSLVPAVDGTADGADVVDTNPLMMFSPAYIADKTGDDLDINQAICRWAGTFGDRDGGAGTGADLTAGESCNGAYQLVRDGHHSYGAGEPQGATGTHTGYKYTGAGIYGSTADMNSDPNYKDTIDCDDVDCDDADVSSAANQGGQYWLRVGEQNKDIQHLRGVHSHELLVADIEAVSVAALAYYSSKLAGDTDYSPADGTTPLTDTQKENRRVLLEAVPGDCFSAGISNSLLYSGGWGAAYFSLGLLLVIAHFVWFYAAMSDDKEGLRFMAKRAMSLFGILVAMIGLYILFFIYGSGQGTIIDDEELRHFANAIGGSNTNPASQRLTSSFIDRLNHGRMSVWDNDSYTSTAVIQACEALHFVILAFAIVVPVTGPDGAGGVSFMGTPPGYSEGSKAGRGWFMSV